MGKKAREEREQKRDSYVEKHQKQKIKYKLIAAGILGGIVLVLAISSYNFYELSTVVTPTGVPPGAGPLGGIHQHATMLVLIYGQQFDFTSTAYQLKSPYIHFEKGNGELIHIFATNVTMGFLFDSLKVGLSDSCYTFPDKRTFCDNSQYTLKFYVNHNQIPDLRGYVAKDHDRILITYGNENKTQIDNQLAGVDSIPFLT